MGLFFILSCLKYLYLFFIQPTLSRVCALNTAGGHQFINIQFWARLVALVEACLLDQTQVQFWFLEMTGRCVVEQVLTQ